jgi:hypothetical protein
MYVIITFILSKVDVILIISIPLIQSIGMITPSIIMMTPFIMMIVLFIVGIKLFTADIQKLK